MMFPMRKKTLSCRNTYFTADWARKDKP